MENATKDLLKRLVELSIIGKLLWSLAMKESLRECDVSRGNKI
jgi:hypothetical protein